MPSRSGDVPEATTELATQSALTHERVISELDLLASVEHALCVEYLVIHCALGHDQVPADPGEVAQLVSEAAASAAAVAQDEMRHLHGVNRVLVSAGRARLRRAGRQHHRRLGRRAPARASPAGRG